MKGILFNTEMVRALLGGQKTVTRRPIKPQPKMRLSYCVGGYGADKWNCPSPRVHEYWGEEWRIPDGLILTDEDKARLWTPPCRTGDILYVRETWARHGNPKAGRPMHYDYRADREDPRYFDSGFMAEWRPSIHMPKEAARIFLKVTNVSVESLQSMRAEDSLREGVKLDLEGQLNGEPALAPFARLWDSTVPKKDLSVYGWDADPWVWRIEFEKISKEEAEARDEK